MQLEALFCVEKFPAFEANIHTAGFTLHHMWTGTGGFDVASLCLIQRVRLLVCPMMQLTCSVLTQRRYRHVNCGVVIQTTFSWPQVGKRAMLSTLGAFFFKSDRLSCFAGWVVSSFLKGPFLLGHYSIGSKCAYPMALFQSWCIHGTGTPFSSQYCFIHT